jgi:hypothetical protein
MEGIDLTLAEEALDATARKAIDRKTGARGGCARSWRYFCSTLVRAAEPRRRRGGGDLQGSCGGQFTAALHLRCSRRRHRRERVVGRACTARRRAAAYVFHTRSGQAAIPLTLCLPTHGHISTLPCELKVLASLNGDLRPWGSTKRTGPQDKQFHRSAKGRPMLPAPNVNNHR